MMAAAGNSVPKHEDERHNLASLKNWGEPPDSAEARGMKHAVSVRCGWGRLIFGQTFDRPEELAAALKEEAEGERDVALYVRDPHVVLASAPQALFLDPSHTFRLDLAAMTPAPDLPEGLIVRKAMPGDETAVNRLYLSWSMVPVADDFFSGLATQDVVHVLLAVEASRQDEVVGVVMGVDHRKAFSDPDNGSSLWALAVDPQARRPGVGETLVLTLAERFRTLGRAFMDLSVMHDNNDAIALYRKLGFEQIPVYCLKKKNPINEKLFVGPQTETELNIYARIIVDEARRRGIGVDIEDAEAGLFRLTLGGRTIACRESLSDLTTAVAMSRCDDKALTRRVLERAGLRVPDQTAIRSLEDGKEFFDQHKSVVVKPARGEQGRGVAVDLRSIEEVEDAIRQALAICNEVVMEEYVAGQDLRIIVIGDAVAAAAIRRPPAIRADGSHTVGELIDKLSRRRAAATGGESRIPMDHETERSVRAAGFAMDDVPSEGTTITVRKTANLHTGGTIHDVTAELHPTLRVAAIEGAQALQIPVVGFDFIVPDPKAADYVVIEANERPGLANHEPQPTAERFVDLLFPQTVVAS